MSDFFTSSLIKGVPPHMLLVRTSADLLMRHMGSNCSSVPLHPGGDQPTR